jgi:hypothetical protein
MTGEEFARKPISVREGSRRAPDERFALLFPALFKLLQRLISRLPPSSRLRQMLVWRAVSQGMEAANRRDFEAVLVRYDPRGRDPPNP